MFKPLLLLVFTILLSTGATAQNLLGQYKDWALFTTKEGTAKLCYITSNPTKKTGTYKVRGNVYIIVTYRGAGTTPEVSIEGGFPYKKDSEVSVDITNKGSFQFFTSEDTPQMAWAKDEKTDNDVVALMKKGNNVVVKATSKKGTKSQDTYSLKGFTAAYDKMISTCK
jgi:invasion protein IalB